MKLPIEKARSLAERLRAELAPFCQRCEVAGSIRRNRPECGDIDLVVLPRVPADVKNILDRCSKHARAIKGGEQYRVFELANGFQLDLWFAHEGGPDPEKQTDIFETPKADLPGNFGVLFLARTGSAMFNVWFASECKRRGLHFNPHKGILRRDRVIASLEEADLFAALDMAVIPPEKRET